MDIDRYLRNNLDDADYAEASAALEAYWQSGYQAGHRAGAEAMRERAAKVLDMHSTWNYSAAIAITACADAIRALPIEGGK